MQIIFLSIHILFFLSSVVKYLLLIFLVFLLKFYLLLIMTPNLFIRSNAINVLFILVQKVNFETWRFGLWRIWRLSLRAASDFR